MQWASSVSTLGNSALLLPLSLFLALLLWRYHSLRAAAYLSSAVLSCVFMIVVLKIAFLACGSAWGVSVISPSAHASVATTVYGALGIVAARLVTASWWRVIIAVAVGSIVALIACSRVILHAHSLNEVCIGLLIGGMATSLFAIQYVRLPSERQPGIALLLGGTLALIVTLQSIYVPFEEGAENIALKIRGALFACPSND
jgi:membrane-associated phospholipid phosphatase